MSIFAAVKFRPSNPEELDWEDNWISNVMAYYSHDIASMCKEETQYSTRFAMYFFTSCPCCLLYRGIFIGVLLVLALDALAVLAYLLI